MVPDSQSSSRKGDVSPAAEPVMVRRNDGNASGSLKWGVSPLSPVATCDGEKERRQWQWGLGEGCVPAIPCSQSCGEGGEQWSH